jgi:predicted DNA-binding protein (MmcQ/YjbR family)
MDIESIREYCLSKPDVTEGFPFDADTLVFKVKEKIFALTSLSGPLSINLKCDPEKAISLREQYTDIIPGYHMNKKHWNTIFINGALTDRMITEMIDHSYDLVLHSGKSKRKK